MATSPAIAAAPSVADAAASSPARAATSTPTWANAHHGRSSATTAPSCTPPTAHAAPGGHDQHAQPRDPGGRLGRQAGQRRGGPGHQQRQHGTGPGTERDGRARLRTTTPTGPPPGGGQPVTRAAPGPAGPRRPPPRSRPRRRPRGRAVRRAASARRGASSRGCRGPRPRSPPRAPGLAERAAAGGVTHRSRGTVAALACRPRRTVPRPGPRASPGSGRSSPSAGRRTGRALRTPVAEVFGRDTGARGTRVCGTRSRVTGATGRAAAGTAR